MGKQTLNPFGAAKKEPQQSKKPMPAFNLKQAQGQIEIQQLDLNALEKKESLSIASDSVSPEYLKPDQGSSFNPFKNNEQNNEARISQEESKVSNNENLSLRNN